MFNGLQIAKRQSGYACFERLLRGRARAHRPARARPRAGAGPPGRGRPPSGAGSRSSTETPPRLVALTISFVAVSTRRALCPVRDVEGDAGRRSPGSARSGRPRARPGCAARIAAVSDWRADPDLERLQPAQQQPGGVGRRDDPGARPQLEQPRGVLGALADDGAEEHVVVAGEILRRGVEDEVAAELEWPQVDGRRRGRVADDETRVRRGRFEVGHRQERIRRRLDPDEVGACGRRAGLVEEDVLEPPALELAEENAGPVVRVLRQRDRRAGREQRRERARSSRPSPTRRAAPRRPRASPSCRSASTPTGCAFRA